MTKEMELAPVNGISAAHLAQDIPLESRTSLVNHNRLESVLIPGGQDPTQKPTSACRLHTKSTKLTPSMRRTAKKSSLSGMMQGGWTQLNSREKKR
jgi:hypothetical protein